jgi:peptide/nickel transport system substrate-binding protein
MGFLQREAKESGYNNPQVDKLINEGNAVLDVENVSRSTTSCIRCWRRSAGDPSRLPQILSASSARVTGFKPDIYNGLTGSLPDVKIVK